MNDKTISESSKKNLISTTLQPPILIDGCPRSGTTLLLNVLGLHKSIHKVEQGNLFVQRNFLNIKYFEKLQYSGNNDSFIFSILTSLSGKYEIKDILKGYTNEQLAKDFEELKCSYNLNSVKNRYDAYFLCLSYLTSKNKKTRWVDREHRILSKAKLILKYNPNAKFIYIVRDPREVCLSRLKQGDLKRSLFDIIYFWNLHQKDFKKLYSTNPSQVYLLKYNELVSNPVQEIKRICNFINEDFDPQMLNVDVYESSFKDVNKGFSTKPIARWKSELNKHSILLIDLLTKKHRQEYDFNDFDTKLSLIDIFVFIGYLFKEVLLYIIYKFRSAFLHFFNWLKFYIFNTV